MRKGNYLGPLLPYEELELYSVDSRKLATFSTQRSDIFKLKTIPDALGKWIGTGTKKSKRVKLRGCYDKASRKYGSLYWRISIEMEKRRYICGEGDG